MNNKNMIITTIILSATIALALHAFIKPQPENNFNYLLRDNGIENVKNGEENKGVKDSEDILNLVLIGLDGDKTRADAIMLVNFNPQNNSVNMLSFARDTRIRIRGDFAKINALKGIGGESLILKAVQQITELDVKYYITFDFKGFREMIDTLGGVVYDVPFDMDYDDPLQNLHIHLKKGQQLLDGNKSEQFVRYRKGNSPNEGYIDGDIGRVAAQQEFFKALLAQKMDIRYATRIGDLISVVKGNIKTNIGTKEIKNYAFYAPRIKSENVKTFMLPGEPRYIDDLWYFICDKNKTKEMIQKNFNK